MSHDPLHPQEPRPSWDALEVQSLLDDVTAAFALDAGLLAIVSTSPNPSTTHS